MSELQHSSGPWKKHKYTKIVNGQYVYDKENGASKASMPRRRGDPLGIQLVGDGQKAKEGYLKRQTGKLKIEYDKGTKYLSPDKKNTINNMVNTASNPNTLQYVQGYKKKRKEQIRERGKAASDAAVEGFKKANARERARQERNETLQKQLKFYSDNREKQDLENRRRKALNDNAIKAKQDISTHKGLSEFATVGGYDSILESNKKWSINKAKKLSDKSNKKIFSGVTKKDLYNDRKAYDEAQRRYSTASKSVLNNKILDRSDDKLYRSATDELYRLEGVASEAFDKYITDRAKYDNSLVGKVSNAAGKVKKSVSDKVTAYKKAKTDAKSAYKTVKLSDGSVLKAKRTPSAKDTSKKLGAKSVKMINGKVVEAIKKKKK